MIWFNEVNKEKLKLEQTLVEYDCEPMLFICKGVDSSNYFLCVCFELFVGFKWAVVETTKDMLFELWNDKISIYDVFCKTEGKKFVIEKMMPNYEENVQEVSKFECEMLPQKDIFLENHSDEVEEYFENLFFDDKEITTKFECDMLDELYFEQWNIEEKWDAKEERDTIAEHSTVDVIFRKKPFEAEFKAEDYCILQQAS